MSKAKYHFFAICANCGKEIVLHEAPSPQQEEHPKSRGSTATCPHCKTTHTYMGREMGRGEIGEEKGGDGLRRKPARPRL
jgi:DNA-directed RNA polymerase subunit RPC12/RpoP